MPKSKSKSSSPTADKVEMKKSGKGTRVKRGLTPWNAYFSEKITAYKAADSQLTLEEKRNAISAAWKISPKNPKAKSTDT